MPSLILWRCTQCRQVLSTHVESAPECPVCEDSLVARLSRNTWAEIGFDMLSATGIGLLSVGLWMFAPWLAFVVLGLILLVTGLLGARAWAF